MWPFRKKNRSDGTLAVLTFKTGEDFFSFQCQFGHTRLNQGQGVAALVVDPEREFGRETARRISPPGARTLLLRVAAPDGGFLVMCPSPAQGEPIQAGDVVIWVPTEHDPQLGRAVNDDRSGWIGFIGAKVAPEIDPASAEFRVLSRYV